MAFPMTARRGRVLARSVAAALLAAATLGLLPPAAGEAAPRTEVSFRDLSISDLAPAGVPVTRGPKGSVRLAREAWSRPGVACSSDRFTTAGLVWRQDGRSDVKAELAWGATTGQVEGTGSRTKPMAVLHADPGDGPDSGSPDDSGIEGTPPVWTDEARCIGFRLKLPADETLSGLRAVFVDTSEDRGDGITAAMSRAWRAVSGVWGFLAPPPAAAVTTRPDVVTRSEWGADEGLRRCSPYYADRLKVAYVHHTAGSNTYSRTQADDVIRGVYAFHVRGRGWCDIAYNFLVDKFGRIYEGRYGGMSKPLIGGHAAGFNIGSAGVAAMGTFTSTEPSKAMIDAFKRLLAWRLDVAHLRPTGRTTMLSTGGGTSKYGAGTVVNLKVITAHRDTSWTSCPGYRLYAKLDAIRKGAEALGLPKLYNPTWSRSVLEPGASSIRYRAALSGGLDWFVDIHVPGGPRVRRLTGHGKSIDATWDGLADDRSPVSPGFYRVKLWARNGATGSLARAAWLDATACSSIGTWENDLLVGSPSDDILCGVGGHDTLRGGGGDDLLIGGPGTDVTDHTTAAAGVSVDLLSATATGQGTDTLSSIEGAIGSPHADTLSGDYGNNALTGGEGDDRLVGRAGNDALRGGDGNDTADYSGSWSGVNANLATGKATGDGSDALDAVENMTGSAHTDVLLGNAAANTLVGLSGPDTIRGRGGDDSIDGRVGADRLYGGDGDDVVDGAGGDDTVSGGLGVDLLWGGIGNDSLYARDDEADTVDGGTGTDGAEVDEGVDIVTGVESQL